ncbi:MAG: ABC transporter substrate-binding protein [Chloroflexi bacterium]|nr:ABC transporter substrate-binding protein [Chloroflexota bacterium]
MVLTEPPPTFSLHETSLGQVTWPVSPAYNNLVFYDPGKGTETIETIIPDLGERWEWSADGKALTFFLRKGVKWHDGTPFTSLDVKYTFDVVREAPDIPSKLRANPRQLWYENVSSIETPNSDTVVFRLKRPESALLALLASGFSVVYPAHVQPVDRLRTQIMGTGPFRFKEYSPGEMLTYERNRDYFKPGLPYLDGMRYTVIRDRTARIAALRTGRVKLSPIVDIPKSIADDIRKNAPHLKVSERVVLSANILLLNHKKPPFNNPKIREAVNLALDRSAHVTAAREGAAGVGTTMLPGGFWALPEAEMRKLPGYSGDMESRRAQAKKLIAEAGDPAGLKLEMPTRSLAVFVESATFVIDQLKRVGIDATMKQMETGPWVALQERRDYTIIDTRMGIAVDDPSPIYAEFYTCRAPRNYTGYCNPDVEAMMNEQAVTTDPLKRRALVWEIDKRLVTEVARPILSWNIDYMVWWPEVRGYVQHQSLTTTGRHETLWLAK